MSIRGHGSRSGLRIRSPQLWGSGVCRDMETALVVWRARYCLSPDGLTMVLNDLFMGATETHQTAVNLQESFSSIWIIVFSGNGKRGGCEGEETGGRGTMQYKRFSIYVDSDQ